MKKYAYLFFALILLWMNWESQTLATPLLETKPIPEESIRLRIIANSDLPRDQWLKREVRDRVVKQMDRWIEDVQTLEEARRMMKDKLPEFRTLVESVIREHEFDYEADVRFGTARFPTKMYGAYVYPAGEYEALKITIGKGEGQNWWCVLFPPLCFVDMSGGDAVEHSNTADEETGGKVHKKRGLEPTSLQAEEKEKDVEIRFFVVDLWKKIKGWLFG